MSTASWTPAVRPGLIPLHPLTFGALLGKPFAALRHNPKVLFGFAIVVQLVVAVITLVVVGAVALATFTRLESLSPSSPDFYPVMWGTIAINALVVLVMAFVSLAFTAVMQGVVAADIGHAALGEKPSLGRLWQIMRPSFWRLVGWSVLQALAGIVLVLVIGGIIALGVTAGVGGSAEGVAFTVVIGILLVLAAIPLWVWLGTKLLLVPSVLVLERARLRAALVRSWRLTRGRFWNTFGVIFLINIIMSTAVSVVSLPLSLLGSLFVPVIAPTGGSDASEIAGLIIATVAPQLLVYVLQAVAIVVQCAAAAFIYLDCRMRYEGLDHSLISHLERRDLGATPEDLGDPFTVDPARAVSSAPPPKPAPTYATPPVGWAQYPAPTSQYPAPTTQAPPPPPPAASAAAAAPTRPAEQNPWAAPGSGGA
ncbi:glycerophosphoryl diester phosphodiesterase membrane domain-containing protein [Microbacterium abyssi]|uniref:glycerophosphoryl diester phosphodiesterase membrane domain-containing protein n=1 Tax=Microbacterium abyssi TaxID=2782166 RepID=UPI0018871C37|nr:glycerophosphoryl diester phosphodiesterase membrane domain-containing protein [Microbacterium sp. A18JL241]